MITRETRNSIVAVLGFVLAAAPASGQEAPKTKAPPACPPVVSDTASIRYGRVFIDGRAVGGNLKVKREGGAPESYEILDPEPAELEHLPVARIDLIQYDNGPEAEARYGLCKGMVAIVISTKKSKRG